MTKRGHSENQMDGEQQHMHAHMLVDDQSIIWNHTKNTNIKTRLEWQAQVCDIGFE